MFLFPKVAYIHFHSLLGLKGCSLVREGMSKRTAFFASHGVRQARAVGRGVRDGHSPPGAAAVTLRVFKVVVVLQTTTETSCYSSRFSWDSCAFPSAPACVQAQTVLCLALILTLFHSYQAGLCALFCFPENYQARQWVGTEDRMRGWSTRPGCDQWPLVSPLRKGYTSRFLLQTF